MPDFFLAKPPSTPSFYFLFSFAAFATLRESFSLAKPRSTPGVLTFFLCGLCASDAFAVLRKKLSLAFVDGIISVSYVLR
jgi:hypothetical protein